MKKIAALLIASIPLAFGATTALADKSGTHFVGDPTCTQSGDVLTCTGSVAGLGSEPVSVQLFVDAHCSTRPDSNDPPGHIGSDIENETPRGGRVFFDVDLDAGCPRGLNAEFGSVVRIVITRGGVTLFNQTFSTGL